MTARPCLLPRYTQVEQFTEDGDYEGEEDVCYVTLDLGTIEPTLVPSSDEYRLIGLDTPTPYLQLSGTVFQGQHMSLLGTELLFSEDKGKRSLAPFGITENRIRFREVSLKPKPAHVEGDESSKVLDSEFLDKVTGKAQPEASTRKGRSKGKGKSKGKKKAQIEVDSDGDVVMERGEFEGLLQLEEPEEHATE